MFYEPKKGRNALQEISAAELHDCIKKEQSFALFVFTPMCGTCKLAERMLEVTSEALPAIVIKKLNINVAHGLAEQLMITSVPALLLFQKGELVARHFAIQSVAFLYEVLKPLV
ncbi:thioredoxin family protein [Brevibacillus reuszeri]|uniref:thioredoxin family protein n=1 Tax=Brevibacillus reuszeri TaxID=54915 RepID=UPI000B098260|nr:thioredoxin family protein [Brevibacillus reuszeri]MED1857880.1 thioredoxin family protein [Brevibacillus reuszeri]